jgi:hypothetical protein
MPIYKITDIRYLITMIQLQMLDKVEWNHEMREENNVKGGVNDSFGVTEENQLVKQDSCHYNWVVPQSTTADRAMWKLRCDWKLDKLVDQILAADHTPHVLQIGSHKPHSF